jgi:RNA polymerase sigma-70 factor (ECF subfamily)
MLRKSRPLDFADLPSEDVEGWAEEGGDLEVAVEEGELLRRLADAVQALPLAYRTVIALRYEAEMPYEEIAGVLGLPINTVRTRLHRAKARLKAALEGVV